MQEKIKVEQAFSLAHFAMAETLINQYVQWLAFDLSFQNLKDEMATLPATYGAPVGALFIAVCNELPVGVAGVKRFNDQACELKRMFVQQSFQGKGVGQQLLTECIAAARQLEYERMMLDTTASMLSAISLYKKNGFVEVQAYRFNPHDEARYFQLDL